MILTELVINSAKRTPDAIAIKDSEGSITFGELDRLANQIARALAELGVTAGDRVGIWLEKSVRTVAAMQGVLRLGAAYVPLDPLAPVSRIDTIIKNCEMQALVSTEKRVASVLMDEPDKMAVLYADEQIQTSGLCWGDLSGFSSDPVDPVETTENDLAYILYTSGSTGIPKGVCISHLNAWAFVEWAAGELRATAKDRFSNHAPFHFDLSVLDLYVPFLVGGAVHLIPDGMSYSPKRLVDFILKEKITIWYSVPSVLILMMEQGGFLEIETNPLRCVLFAGEPFPMKHLRRLCEKWSDIRFLNLYGPTETNVCTYYEVTKADRERTKPVPIGKACSGDKAWAVTRDGEKAQPGEEGELLVTGPTVMMGYWGREPHGDKPYPTGDIVRVLEDGSFDYVGRRDHMVKVRGHRVELGDIEAALNEHPAIHEVAVVVTGQGMEARLVAYAATNGAERPPLLEIKRHCSERLPRYMIIDDINFLETMPRTRNGKIDRLKLGEAAESALV